MMKMIWLLALALLAVPVAARSSGAPSTACQTMIPTHGTNVPRSDTSPFTILVSQAVYRPGDNITVMLKGMCGNQFLGFLIQARRVDKNDVRTQQRPLEALGVFSLVPGSRFECGEGRNTLTHAGRLNVTSLVVTWTAPTVPQGHLQFTATLVQKFETFWTKVTSAVIQDPASPPLSVSPGELRSPFTPPCDGDRPTTSTAVAVTTTTLTTSTPTQPTTPTNSLINPSTPVDLVTTTQTFMTSSVVQEPLPTGPPSHPLTTPASTADVKPPSWSVASAFEADLMDDPKCGQDRGCFLSCRAKSCDAVVMWADLGDHVWFDIRAKMAAKLPAQYVAVGFSSDTQMGSDSVVECLVTSDHRNTVQLSYNSRFDNSVLEQVEGVLVKEQIEVKDGTIRCQFARKKFLTREGQIYDLEKDWYIFVAQGLVKNGLKEEHVTLPAVSSKMADFQSRLVLYQASKSNIFIKAHACMMLVAWVFCASVGTVMARFYKHLWPHTMLCGRKVWFTVHRACMMLAAALTVAAFVLVFLHVKGLSDISILRLKKLHPVIGIAGTALVLLQTAMGLFRPSSLAQSRPVFNCGHLFLGATTHLVTVFNLVLGCQLQTANIHFSITYMLYAFAAYHVLVFLTLEIILCKIRVNVKKQQSYAIYEMRNAMYSSTKDLLDVGTPEPKGAAVLRVVLGTHALLIGSLTTAMVAMVILLDGQHTGQR